MTLTDLERKAEAKAVERRKLRWRLHHWRRHHSAIAGGRSCMNSLPDVLPQLSVTRSGVGHWAGVGRCGSFAACPTCRPVVGERRAGEIDTILARALSEGHSVFFVTATLQHKLGRSLDSLYALLASCWRKTFQSRRVSAPEYLGQIRVFEFTHGANGWHPHVHAVIVWEGDEASGRAFLEALGTRFRAAVAKRGGYSSAARGWRVDSVRVNDRDAGKKVASYVAKIEDGWGAGLELARGDLKTVGGRTPFQLLQLAADGDWWAAELFREYERVTHRRHLLRIAPELARRFRVELATPEAAAEGPAPAEAEVLGTVYLSRRGHARLLNGGRVADFLDVSIGLLVDGEVAPDWWHDCVAFVSRAGPALAVA